MDSLDTLPPPPADLPETQETDSPDADWSRLEEIAQELADMASHKKTLRSEYLEILTRMDERMEKLGVLKIENANGVKVVRSRDLLFVLTEAARNDPETLPALAQEFPDLVDPPKIVRRDWFSSRVAKLLEDPDAAKALRPRLETQEIFGLAVRGLKFPKDFKFAAGGEGGDED